MKRMERCYVEIKTGQQEINKREKLESLEKSKRKGSKNSLETEES